MIPDLPAPAKPPEEPIDAGEEGKPKWGYEPIDWDYVDTPIQNLEPRRQNRPNM
ncbi:MAG: hypothetical protein ACRD21_11755 [Vicinamibacteria bacterium]